MNQHRNRIYTALNAFLCVIYYFLTSCVTHSVVVVLLLCAQCFTYDVMLDC